MSNTTFLNSPFNGGDWGKPMHPCPHANESWGNKGVLKEGDVK